MNPPPGLRTVAVPDLYRKHPLLQGAPYYTIPKLLLDFVVKEVRSTQFDSELLGMERILSEVAGDHTQFVGFWRGSPICYSDLRQLPLRIDDDQLADLAKVTGKHPVHIRRTMQLADSRLRWTNTVRRGFSGWLMTNREFLIEQKTLLDAWTSDIRRHGIPVMGAVVRDVSEIPGGPVMEEGPLQSFVQAFEKFLVRWRLAALPAPLAPVPLGMHLPVTNLPLVLGHMGHAGTTFYLPDIFPVPSRDELRVIIEECLRYGGAPEHLAGWGKLVQSTNSARNRLYRYARIFELQHYVRTLYGRHSEALSRKQSSLILALASFLKVNDATIKSDLRYIARKLGRDWYLP